jgi:hypothetical protein
LIFISPTSECAHLYLSRERVIVPGPTACACCGGARLSKLGEDITETLEVIPKSLKVIQHVREKFTCRDCEKIDQAPARFHVIDRGWAAPGLLAMVLMYSLEHSLTVFDFGEEISFNQSSSSPSILATRLMVKTRVIAAIVRLPASTAASAFSCES